MEEERRLKIEREAREALQKEQIKHKEIRDLAKRQKMENEQMKEMVKKQ